MSNKITLYPSNWLYNAGVVGFLRVLQECEENVEDFLKDDGSAEIDKKFFSKIKIDEIYFGKDKIVSIVGKSSLYRNYLQPQWKDIFPHFVKNLGSINVIQDCGICGEGKYLDRSVFQNLSKDKIDKDKIEKFLTGIERLDVRLNNMLAPSLGEFPNSFWNTNFSTKVCHLCGYILIHHHLSLTKLSDNSEIFINAPSFKVMWYLNKYAREISEKQKVKQVKEIFGISLIEMTRRLNLQLGIWTTMNIEVVSKYKVKKDNQWEDKIEFFSLPYEIVRLISNSEIASTLNDIGEFKILNMVLDGRFNKILEMGERIFRISLKPKNERGKNENEFINENIKLEKNRKDLISFSQKLFKLYALINEKLKKEVAYGF